VQPPYTLKMPIQFSKITEPLGGAFPHLLKQTDNPDQET